MPGIQSLPEANVVEVLLNEGKLVLGVVQVVMLV